jgi:hypothetical protein
VTLIGTGKATVGVGVTFASGVALTEMATDGVGEGAGSDVDAHPASSTTIAMTMTRRRFTGSF